MISGISRSPLASKVNLHLALAGLLHLGDLLVVGAVIGAPVIAQQRVREDHVVDGDRRAVGELRLGAQRELDEAAVGGRLDALGDQAVKREGLVIGAGEQALIDDIRARRRPASPLTIRGLRLSKEPCTREDRRARLWARRD